jgi:hypothetical protein
MTLALVLESSSAEPINPEASVNLSDPEPSCGAVQQQANTCDNQNNNDSAELQCICNGQNMQNLVPQCQACIAENSNNPDDLDSKFSHH